jgi:hypothetical protein
MKGFDGGSRSGFVFSELRARCLFSFSEEHECSLNVLFAHSDTLLQQRAIVFQSSCSITADCITL